HSQGEYVFDHGWANAFERAGGRYYPKLQCSIPFTPVTGPRLLSAAGPDPRPVREALAAGLKELSRRHGVSSAHVT
ncbi:peptidogalycan biosysnthesis protein, partial [Klebsiella pneumoniae]|nr:peptidogalycan biosysnthesis protein [Klebsiella pneumoniae]